MHHFIFNLADGDRDRAKSFLHAKRWVVNRGEHHRDALAPGDLALIFVALTREFVGRVELKTTSLDPMASDPATSAPAVSGVLLRRRRGLDERRAVGRRCDEDRSEGAQPLLTPRSQTPEKLGPASTHASCVEDDDIPHTRR
jgi:hypothetical protein